MPTPSSRFVALLLLSLILTGSVLYAQCATCGPFDCCSAAAFTLPPFTGVTALYRTFASAPLNAGTSDSATATVRWRRVSIYGQNFDAAELILDYNLSQRLTLTGLEISDGYGNTAGDSGITAAAPVVIGPGRGTLAYQISKFTYFQYGSSVTMRTVELPSVRSIGTLVPSTDTVYLSNLSSPAAQPGAGTQPSGTAGVIFSAGRDGSNVLRSAGMLVTIDAAIPASPSIFIPGPMITAVRILSAQPGPNGAVVFDAGVNPTDPSRPFTVRQQLNLSSSATAAAFEDILKNPGNYSIAVYINGSTNPVLTGSLLSTETLQTGVADTNLSGQVEGHINISFARDSNGQPLASMLNFDYLYSGYPQASRFTSISLGGVIVPLSNSVDNSVIVGSGMAGVLNQRILRGGNSPELQAVLAISAQGLGGLSLSSTGTPAPVAMNVQTFLNPVKTPAITGILGSLNSAIVPAASPGGAITIQGTFPGGSIAAPPGSPLPTGLNNIQVYVGGLPAKISSVSPTAIVALVPDQLDPQGGRFVEVRVSVYGVPSQDYDLFIDAAEPSILKMNDGDGWVVGQDGNSIRQATPAAAGSQITAYLGEVGPASGNTGFTLDAYLDGKLLTNVNPVPASGIGVKTVSFQVPQGTAPGSHLLEFRATTAAPFYRPSNPFNLWVK